MAYDPNDPKDKEAVQVLIDEALASQAETHEAEIAGLKKNRDTLKDQLKKARAGEAIDDNSGDIERLETELRTTQSELRKAQKEARDAVRARDDAKATADQESAFSQNLLIENALTTNLAENNVAPQYIAATKALLRGQLKVEGEGADRKVVGADGKPVGDFVKSWSQGDEGKPFVKAPANGGGGANGNTGAGGAGDKAFKDMTSIERKAFKDRDPAGFKAANDIHMAARGSG